MNLLFTLHGHLHFVSDEKIRQSALTTCDISTMLIFSKIPLNKINIQETNEQIIDVKSQKHKYVLVHI